MPDVEQSFSTTNDGVQNNPQLSKQKSNAKPHNGTSTGHRVIEHDEDDPTMTEAETQEMGNANSPARPDNPATVSWLEGEVLDQAKGPPPLEPGLVDIHNSDADDDSSKA